MTTSDILQVMVVGPSDVTVHRVTNHYQTFNHLVGDGSISSCPLPRALRDQGLYAYCDDDAISRQQQENKYATHLGRHVLRGPVMIFRVGYDGDEQSLRPSDVTFLERYFKERPTDEARDLVEEDRMWWSQHPSGVSIQSLDW